MPEEENLKTRSCDPCKKLEDTINDLIERVKVSSEDRFKSFGWTRIWRGKEQKLELSYHFTMLELVHSGFDRCDTE